MSEKCHWMQDGEPESDTWSTACGGMFAITDGTPSENRMRYCCYCGKPLSEVPLVYTDDGDVIYRGGESDD